MDDFSTITYALFGAGNLGQAISAAKQRRQKREEILMKNRPIFPRILDRGVPEDKAAKVTVRCVINQNGPVKTQTETDHDQSK